MNTAKIDGILRKRCKGMFLGVYARDRLPNKLPAKRPLMLVCNTDPHNKPGEHWVVLYIGNDSCGEYFDSFAMNPCLTFERYLNKYCKRWTSCKRHVQNIFSKYCGHYCIFYSLFRSIGYDIDVVIDCFKDDTVLNDLMVHKFVCELL